ncbi:hypothetical protein G9A89_019105 [Geosiphon pyriformis]|nr:hypothetical protein G9A89_019105 [Geosiphon pyriformis]
MHVCHYCGKQGYLKVSNSKLLIKLSNISTKLHTYDTATNLLTTTLTVNNTCHLSTAAPTHLSASTNSNTTTKLTSKQNPKAKTDTTELEIIDGRSQQQNLGTKYTQNPNFQNYLSLLVTSKDVTSDNSEANQKPLTNHIPPAIITEDELLNTIFLFELKELSTTPLFSEATLKEKLIITIYTNAKVNGHPIKLILNSGSANSIITRQFMDQLEPVINLLDPEQFYEHYQELAPIREEQKQHLEEINTQLCDHCLIPYDFQYCNECDLIYNPPIHMIYTISEEEEPINSCALESESTLNSDSNSDNNNNENNSSSSAQCGNEKYSDSNSDSNSEQYIAPPDLNKEQELKWFSDNNKGIMPKRVHDTNVGFDLRYLEKNSIKLESYLCTYIDFKIALEISMTTMVQLAFRSSLAKKGINIRGGIINTRYVGNIIAILQNDSKKAYIIDPNKKIAQAMFLSLIKVAQLVLVKNREKLGITARGIQRFGSTGRIDVLVNMTEEEIINKEKTISICQTISIPLYDQYIVVIERKVKDQVQIFEAEVTLCKLGEIRLINLHIPAKNHSHIKISIYNNTGDVIKILEGTIIEYLTTEIENQLPDIISDFPQLCGYVNITLQTIYR